MSLCGNRDEPFSTHSAVSRLPTSCFIDIIIIPLPTWLYFAFLLVTALIHRNLASRVPQAKATRSCGRISLVTLYYVLIVANLLMVTLEVVRLALAGLGVGLLPFTYVALIAAAAMRATNGALFARKRGWHLANIALWWSLVLVEIVKLVQESNAMAAGSTYQRIGTKYPLSDQIIDNAVIVGVYVVLACLEGVMRSGQGSMRSV